MINVSVAPMAPPRKLPKQQPAPKQATISAAEKSVNPWTPGSSCIRFTVKSLASFPPHKVWKPGHSHDGCLTHPKPTAQKHCIYMLTNAFGWLLTHVLRLYNNVTRHNILFRP